MDRPEDRSYNRGLFTGERDAVFRVRRLGVRRKVFAAAAASFALLVAGGALALAMTAGATSLGGLDDTTASAPTQTEPAPDPAPTPKHTSKPAPKPAPKSAPVPHRTYTAPTRTYSAPSYTPAPPAATTHPTKPRVTTKQKKKRPSKKSAVTTSTPVETTPTPAVLVPVPVGAKRAASETTGDPTMTSVLFIAGVTFAALLFLLAATVPGTPARFTPVGRVVIEHQQDLVLVGVAAFVITVFVYILTGHGL